MNWLLKMITGNPLVLLWMALAVFGFGVASGGGAAWFVQGLRLTHAEQEFTQYKLDQKALIQKAKDEDDKRRKEAESAYKEKQKQLDASIDAGDAYRRCVSAGKCGRMLIAPVAAGAGVRLPPVSGQHDDGGSAVPIAREPAPEIVGDCSRVQLRLNQLQGEIEAQPGYSQ